MTDATNDTLELPVSMPTETVASTPKRGNWKPKLRWFAAETLIVVIGVLIALSLNTWGQGRQNAASEESYLALISRDLGQMLDDLEELREYEDHQIEGGLEAYRTISAEGRSREQMAVVSDAMLRLTSRRTMNPTDATYQDLLSTGNLQLIRNRELRGQIVAFHERVEREFEIHNKNNTFFVDELFGTAIFGRGLFFSRAGSSTTFAATRNSENQITEAFEGGYANDPDPIWSLPYSSREWTAIKGQLLQRIRVSGYARERAETLLQETIELKEAVDAELAGH